MRNFFETNPIYGIKDFRRNVLVLNKTPIHTPVTDGLSSIRSLLEEEAAGRTKKNEYEKSQELMAEILLKFHESLESRGKTVPVWIIGCSKLVGTSKSKGLFEPFTKAFYDLYKDKPHLLKNVLVFCHFSRTSFTRDLGNHYPNWKSLSKDELKKALADIGTQRKEAIFGRAKKWS